MLTQLTQAGWFDGVLGVACGTFSDCGDPQLVERLLRARLAPLDVPLVLDLPVGHQPTNHALPLGRPVRLDGDAGTLE
jgi:muramoyltetrapeptide carboxypeptidase